MVWSAADVGHVVARFIHFARSSETYEEPLSDSSLGRCGSVALSTPEASAPSLEGHSKVLPICSLVDNARLGVPLSY